MIYPYPPTFFRVHGFDFYPFSCENCSAESKDRATDDDLFISESELRVGQGMYSTGEHSSVHQNVHGDEVRGCWGETLVSRLVLLASKTEISIFIKTCLYILKGSRNIYAF